MDVNMLAGMFPAVFGAGEAGDAPTAKQWSRLLRQSADEPIALVNLFKIRKTARYPDQEFCGTGEEAFQRYAAVSIPTVARVGGEFLLLGDFVGSFVGPEEDWDMVAVARYPNLAALIALHESKDYQRCYRHRAAACERQKVFACR